MARPRSIPILVAAAAMAGALFTGTAWAAPAPYAAPTTGPAAAATTPAPGSAGLSPSAAGTSSGNATFGIQPATGKAVDSRSAIAYAATGGSAETDHIAVTNYSATSLSLHVYSTDAYNTADGGFSVLPSTTKPTDLGLWITLAETFITIPGKSTAIIPFTLKVPMNAAPGDHTGGIVASLTTMTHDAKGNQVAVESRVGTRVSVRVPGALKARLSVTGISAVYHNSVNPFGAGSATISYIVTNTGNVRLTGTQAVRVTSWFGGSEQSAPIGAIKELLPGDSMRVTTEVAGITPAFSATARISVTPAAYPGDLDPAFSTVVQTGSMAAVPWALLVLILLVLGVAYLAWRRYRLGRALRGIGGSGGPGDGGSAGPGGSGGPGGAKTRTTGVRTPGSGSGSPARTGSKTTAPKPTAGAGKPKATVPVAKVPVAKTPVVKAPVVKATVPKTAAPAPKAKAAVAKANQNPNPNPARP